MWKRCPRTEALACNWLIAPHGKLHKIPIWSIHKSTEGKTKTDDFFLLVLRMDNCRQLMFSFIFSNWCSYFLLWLPELIPAQKPMCYQLFTAARFQLGRNLFNFIFRFMVPFSKSGLGQQIQLLFIVKKTRRKFWLPKGTILMDDLTLKDSMSCLGVTEEIVDIVELI